MNFLHSFLTLREINNFSVKSLIKWHFSSEGDDMNSLMKPGSFLYLVMMFKRLLQQQWLSSYERGKFTTINKWGKLSWFDKLYCTHQFPLGGKGYRAVGLETIHRFCQDASSCVFNQALDIFPVHRTTEQQQRFHEICGNLVKTQRRVVGWWKRLCALKEEKPKMVNENIKLNQICWLAHTVEITHRALQ